MSEWTELLLCTAHKICRRIMTRRTKKKTKRVNQNHRRSAVHKSTRYNSEKKMVIICCTLRVKYMEYEIRLIVMMNKRVAFLFLPSFCCNCFFYRWVKVIHTFTNWSIRQQFFSWALAKLLWRNRNKATTSRYASLCQYFVVAYPVFVPFITHIDIAT